MKEITFDYIRGFADGEGHIDQYGRIWLGNCNQVLLLAIQTKLKTIKIPSRIVMTLKKAKTHYKTFYRLYTQNCWYSAKLWEKYIGFSDKDKAQQLDYICNKKLYKFHCKR